MNENRLLRWFHRLFPRPVFPGDAKRTRLGAMINDFFGVAIIVGSINLVIIVPLGLYVSKLAVFLTFAAVSLSVFALMLVRRGWIYAVAAFGTVMLTLLGLSGLYEVGTVQSLQMTAFFTAIMFSTLSLGARLGGTVTSALVLIFLGFTYAETMSLLPAVPRPSPWTQWILFLTHGFLIYLLSVLIRRHMAEAVSEEQKLTEKVLNLLTEVTTAKELADEMGARYRTVVDNVAESIAIVQAGKIVFGNPRLEKLLRCRLDTLIGESFKPWIHADDLPRLLQIEKARTRGEKAPLRVSVRIRSPDGDITWVEASVVHIIWQGQPATLAFITDISARRRLEESLERSLVDATTARRHAEAASNFKSSFLANISHEIRTPMNSIIGMSLLAERTELTPQQRDYLSKIRISGDHLLNLIDSILDLSKIEVGKLELEHVPFSLLTLLAQLHAMLQPRADDRGLSFSISVPPDLPPTLRGDPLRLRQILLNLGANAIKFTDHGSVEVVVEAVTATVDSIELRFTVSDTGIGLTPEQLKRLFTDFAQADASISRQYGGTGLGLAISRQLVELMGGCYGAESEPGHGSHFWFTVPLELGAAEACDAVSPAPTFQDLPASLAGTRVLLADDNSFNRQVVTEFLVAAGIQVTTVDNGAEAVSLALREAFDCLLMDVQMPILDGIAATRQIRSMDHRHVLILALTASATIEDRQRCLAAGMDEVIAKPIDPERLLATLAQHLQRTTPPRTPPPTTQNALQSPWPNMLAGPIDPATLRRIASNDSTKADEFARRFLALLAAAQEDVGLALAANQTDELARIAHRLKASAEWIGAGGLAAEYDALQTAAAGGDIAEVRRRVEEINRLAATIQVQLATA
jgi:PAS domain S-box-containing protein